VLVPRDQLCLKARSVNHIRVKLCHLDQIERTKDRWTIVWFSVEALFQQPCETRGFNHLTNACRQCDPLATQRVQVTICVPG
jgi:hypothetical protein